MTDGQEPAAEGQEPTPAPEQVQDDEKQYSQDYVQELRQEAAKYRTELRKVQDALQGREEQELAEQEKYKELADKYRAQVDELTPVQERYNAMIEQLRESNEKRIEDLPEAMRSLVPEYDDPAKLRAWLDANADKLRKPQAPSLNGGAGGGKRPGEDVVLNEQERAAAQKMGITPEEYAKFK